MKRMAYWLVPGLATLAATGGPALAQYRDYPYYGHMMWGGEGGGWFMAPVMMLLFFVILIAVVVLLVKWLWPGHTLGHPGHNVKSAITILEERYARGEIDKEEFEEKKRALGG